MNAKKKKFGTLLSFTFLTGLSVGVAAMLITQLVDTYLTKTEVGVLLGVVAVLGTSAFFLAKSAYDDIESVVLNE